MLLNPILSELLSFDRLYAILIMSLNAQYLSVIPIGCLEHMPSHYSTAGRPGSNNREGQMSSLNGYLNSRLLRLTTASCFGLILFIGLLLTMSTVYPPDRVLAQDDRILAPDPTPRYVAPLGNDTTNDCTNQDMPCATVQHAVDQAVPSDEIRVATGTYTDIHPRPRNDINTVGVITQVVFIDKTVTIQGGYTTTFTNTNSPDPTRYPTTLDAQGQGRVFYITGNISPTIKGLRITGGDAAGLVGDPSNEDAGGGVYVYTAKVNFSNNQIFGNTAQAGGGLYVLQNANVTLTGNTITNNTGLNRAGGVYFRNSSQAALTANTISNNVANHIGEGQKHHGGAYFVSSPNATLINNTISGNRAADRSGGIGFSGTDNATLIGNKVINNHAGSIGFPNSALGGGLYFVSSNNAHLIGNTVIDNSSVAFGGGLFLENGSVQFDNNIIARNNAPVGDGIYMAGTAVLLGWHNTFVGSNGEGLRLSTANNSALLTNTIFTSFTTAVNVQNGTATLNRTLWFGNVTKTLGVTPANGNNPEDGDPIFIDPVAGNYHITFTTASAARDQGVFGGPAKDIDGSPRPAICPDSPHIPDIGADENACVYLPIIICANCEESHFSLDYGPYRPGQSPGGATPSPAELNEDIAIIKQETNLIRTYGACADELAAIPSIANGHNIKVYQGVNLGPTPSLNDQEISCLAELLAKNPNITTIVIGGEVLLFEHLTEAELIAYINQAKQITNKPFTTGESWGIWCNWSQNVGCQGRPSLAAAVDFILVHTHPYWEGIPIEHGAAHVVATYITLRGVYPGHNIVIGETGWPSCGDPFGNAVPGLENQRQFIEELWPLSKLYNFTVLYFEAFDENWKAAIEGEVGRCWGLYSTDRTPKHQDLDWSIPSPEPIPTTPTVRIEHPQGINTTTTKSNCAIPIFGRVYNAKPGWHVKVEVFTDQWYIQNKWYPDGLAPIIDNMWSVPEIFLSNQNAPYTHKIRATLVDETGTTVASDQIDNIMRINVSCSP